MTHTIDFVIFEGALGLDVTGPLDVFHTANLIMERTSKLKKYELRFVTGAKSIRYLENFRFDKAREVLTISLNRSINCCVMLLRWRRTI